MRENGGYSMIFTRKDKYHNPMIEALTEPAFVFASGGNYLYSNFAARSILKMLGYTVERKPEHCDAFVRVLQFSASDNESGAVTVGGQRYTISNTSFDGGILVRLEPLHEDDHMLRLSASLDIMPWGLLTLDLTGDRAVVVFCNKQAGDFLQVAHQSMVGLAMTDVLTVFGISKNVSSHFQEKTITHYDHEAKIDDKTIWYRFHFIPYQQGHDYCLVVIEDTTNSKIMEGQYFQAQRLESLGQLAGGVAHDFNNILSIIDGYARMAKKTVQGNEEALGHLDRIAQSVQRGSALTTQLLTFGRHKVLKDTVVDLGQLVLDQEALIRPLMDASVVMTINAGENIMVDVAPDNICQILLNVCINSRDAMPDGGTLLVEVGRENSRAFLRIIDTGTGMPPEVKAKMFDPFFTTKDQGKGTGLGLSMVYGLVKDMNGDIEVVTKQGSGTALTIYLPLSAHKPTSHEMSEDENGNIHLEGFTAMIAEDEPDLLHLVSGMLEEMGAKVLKASNGNEALAMQEDYDGNIDFLLTDVVMPELNGVKLAELFEAVRPDSKVMFMSGYPTKGQMARVALPEDAFFMPKPVDYKKLGSVLKSMVAREDNIKDRWKALTGHWRSV